ncbi:MAG: porin [Firmicutes bacterium]|nr:porin [Bacillota bacterium]
MKKRVLSSFLPLILFLLLTTVIAFAEEESKKDVPKIGMKFYLQGSSLANSNNPSSNLNDYRILDQKANSINLDLVEAFVYKDATKDSSLGFRVKLVGGETARYIHARGLCANPDNQFDVYETNVTWAIPGDGKMKLTVGKMATFIGAEVIEAADNPNYSRSYLFNYAEPVTHTGAKLSYDFSSKVSASAYYVNGWDNFADNNNARSIGFSLGLTPSDSFSTSFNILTGPEQDRNTKDNRFLFDWVGTIKPCKNLTFLLNYDYGTEQNVLPDGGKATWNGFSGIAKYDFNDKFSLAVRGEQFSDPDGYRTGVSQTLKEFTLSPQFKVNDHILIRPEYRYDCSDKKSFNDGKSKNQSTYGIGVMVNF